VADFIPERAAPSVETFDGEDQERHKPKPSQKQVVHEWKGRRLKMVVEMRKEMLPRENRQIE